jgi:predicted nucleic acid-binding protein
MDEVFKKADNGEVALCFCIWNIGEAIAVFDRYNRRGLIKIDYALTDFMNELNRLISRNLIEIIDVNNKIMTNGVELVLKHHIYIADAIQISCCTLMKCDKFITSDKRLHEIATREGLNSVLI